jgi:ligand-binding sensor domain-containing protein
MNAFGFNVLTFQRFNALTLFIAFCASQVLSADDSSPYATHNWQVQDGLPHNSIQAIAQTRDGYLWLGTPRGLARFDGDHFTVFDENSVGILKSPSITALCAAKDGTLWIGTHDGGVISCQSGKFSRLVGANTDDSVRALFVGSDQALWIGTTNGLVRFQNGKPQRLLESDAVWSVCEDTESNLCLATSDGAKKLKTGQTTLLSDVTPAFVQVVHCSREGDLWIGARDGLYRISESKPQAHFSKEQGLSSEAVTAIHEDRAGIVWIGTANGLNYLTPDNCIHELKHDGDPLDSVSAIFEDREGNLWVGARDGLYRLNPKLFTMYGRKQGLANQNVTSILEDKSRIWIGTWGGGLECLETNTIKRLPITNSWFNDLVLGLAQDRQGSVWIGTDFEGGMYRYDRSGAVFRYWKTDGMSLLGDPAQRTILIDNQKGRVWVGTRNSLNVAYRSKPFVRYTKENGLAGNAVNVILEDARSAVWVGTDGGLTRFSEDKLTDYTTKDGLVHNTINALCEDADNNLWIGTAGGLNRFKNAKFTAYTSRHGLFSDEIFEIVEDNYNRLWMTSRAGIFWAARADFDALDAGKISAISCVSYGKDDGLATVTCNNAAKPSAIKTLDGRLWFATAKGLAVVDPASISRTVRDPPPVVIEDFVYDRNAVSLTEPVELPPGRGELEFHFTALSFQAPERNRFKYELEGVDTDWIDAGTHRSAHYNNIYPGKYRFRVQACDSLGVWNIVGASLAFRLQPHFWQTRWFEFAIVAAAGLVIAGLYRFRVSRIKQMERWRVRIAADLHDEIGSSIGSISLLTRKIQKEGQLAEDQKSDLSSINRISTQAANSIRDIVWFINPQYDTMQDLILRMKDAAAAVATGTKLHFNTPQENLSRKLAPEFRRHVFLMFKEILTNIAKHAKATEVEIVLVEKKGVWLLMIRDNGIGFDPAAMHNGNGLKNLRQRAEKLSGTLEIRSQAETGTTVIFSTNKV